MNFYLYAAFCLTIYIAGVISLVRFKNINEMYYPFIFCVWIGCINETLSIFLMLRGYQSLVNNNIYVLVESLLLIWFLKKIGVFRKHGSLFNLFNILLIIFWVSETFLFKNITQNSTFFRIFYSLVVVLFSITAVNHLVFSNRKNLLGNSTFLLCISFIIYFSYKILVQAFVANGVSRNSSFLLNLYLIMIYINLGVNLLYALAVLWMPEKLRFSSQF